MIEKIPDDEPARIANITKMTVRQLQLRYPGSQQVLRGVHPKGHGCVRATFEVLNDLDEQFRQGVFTQPGKKYSTVIRFSNASTSVGADSKPGENGAPTEHGSRGMAVKLFGVDGPRLDLKAGNPEQDFLMINQPCFAFANVEDYEGLSIALVNSIDPNSHKDNPGDFFKSALSPANLNASQRARVMETMEIITRIRTGIKHAEIPEIPDFQTPPASPLDNEYFSASPFMFGPTHVMRFKVTPVSPSVEPPQISDPNYLRSKLVQRLRDTSAGDVEFHFMIQIRHVDEIDPARDIENASHAWPDEFHHIASLTIPLQEFDTPGPQNECEQLEFSPWRGLEAHRPLGGINRLRRAVYEASAGYRKTS